jgi:hypothetical protein
MACIGTAAAPLRCRVSFGDDTTSHNFVYDAWVYLDASVANISNLEYHPN